MKTWSLMTSGLALAVLLLSPVYAGDDAKRTWTFDDDETGAIAKGFTNEVGEWKVVASDKGKAPGPVGQEPEFGLQRHAHQRHQRQGRRSHGPDEGDRGRARSGRRARSGGPRMRRTTTSPATTRSRTTTASTTSSTASGR